MSLVSSQYSTLNSLHFVLNKNHSITIIKCIDRNSADLIEEIELTDNKSQFTFHFLTPYTEYKIEFYNNNNECVTTKYYKTLSNDIKNGISDNIIQMIAGNFKLNPKHYISPSNLNSNNFIKFEEWICKSDNDWMWTFTNNNKFFKILYLNGLFTLPSCNIANVIINSLNKNQKKNNFLINNIKLNFNFDLVTCPNPINRQIIDLRSLKNKQIFRTARKLKKYKKQFYISVNFQVS